MFFRFGKWRRTSTTTRNLTRPDQKSKENKIPTIKYVPSSNENKNKSSDSHIPNDGGNNRASISQASNEGVNKSADVDEWKPFIAVNLDDQEERDSLASSTTTRKTPMSSSKRPPTTGFVIKQVLGFLILPNI